AQRAENNQKNNKKDNFYIISIEIVFFYLSWDFMSHTLFMSDSSYSNIYVESYILKLKIAFYFSIY
ncbi:hypothetical protein QVA53_10905, partial [Staphylococcus epidermidis]|uniref:hypothetical protein n=1 Tax=Staphylococcus epidermidis TaxID=1282 RepID=UPI0029051485